MFNISSRLKSFRQTFSNDSLIRNAVYLLGSTAIMSILGFVFWIFVAHLYSTSEIGIASALISITLLISNLSMLGLNAGLIRFLPTSKNQSRDINAAIITVAGAAMVATLIYLLIGRLFDGSVNAFIGNVWSWPIFMILMAAVALNTLTDAVFIANRRAEYHTIVYTSFGITKLFLPLILVPLASLGVFLAYIGAVLISLALSFYFMWRNCGYRINSSPNWSLITQTQKYSSSNYVGVLLAGLPSQLLPSLIINSMGASYAAYYSMAWTMANLLYVIPSSITQSLLAESSHTPNEQSHILRRAVKILFVIIVPAVIVAVTVAPVLLRVFGQQYSTGSTQIFQIMALSTFFIAINAVSSTVLNVQKRSFGIVISQIAFVTVTMGSALLLLHRGLIGIGFSMMLGYIASNIVYGIIFFFPWRESRGKLSESSLKVNISAIEIEALLAQYDLKRFRIKYLTVDAPNQAVLVETRLKKYVLRIYNPENSSVSAVVNEIDFMNQLILNDLPIPKIILNNIGEEISVFKTDVHQIPFILMEHIKGNHVKRSTDTILAEMAKVQASIHLSGSRNLTSEINNETTHKFSYRQRLFRYVTLLAYTPQGLSHFDYTLSNILVDEGHLRCVLDFEGMRKDSLIICLLYTLANLEDTELSQQIVSKYLKEYQTIRKLNLLEKVLLRVGLTVYFRSPKYLTFRY